MNSKLIILGIIALLMLTGCTHTMYQPLLKIKDTGNKVTNYELCYAQLQRDCSQREGCVSFSQDENIICDKGECIC